MKIVRYPHPALRHAARPVTGIDSELRRIVGQMLDLMYENKGLGLAAPRVGLPFQLFVMNSLGDATESHAERVYINPEISDKRGSIEGEEGCLSFPGLYQKVRRARQIRVQAYDQRGQPIDSELEDLEARIVQHETDHLFGRLFIDYFGPIQKLSSRSAIAEFERDFRRSQEKGEIASNKALLRELRELETKETLAGVML
jgi:peptide deformylase